MHRICCSAALGLAIAIAAAQANAGSLPTDGTHTPTKLCRIGPQTMDTGFTVPKWFTAQNCFDYIKKITNGTSGGQVGCIDRDGSIWLDGDRKGRDECHWQ